MSLIEKFMEQREMFETAYESGNWQNLRPFFAENVIYEVSNISFHCEVRGIDNFISGLKRATDGFDKLCKREINVGDYMIAQEGNKVLVHSVVRFARDDSPPIESGLWEIASYEDGLITRMIDVYDPGVAEQFSEWMGSWGEGLDPRYQDS